MLVWTASATVDSSKTNCKVAAYGGVFNTATCQTSAVAERLDSYMHLGLAMLRGGALLKIVGTVLTASTHDPWLPWGSMRQSLGLWQAPG